MKEHICRQIRYCSCMSNAVDPDEDCLIHGFLRQQPRCSYCGRFLKNKPEVDIFNAAAKHSWFGSSQRDGNIITFLFFDYESEESALMKTLKDQEIYKD